VLNDKQILALLFDQHAHTYSETIDFFGHPAATHKTIALLHLVTRAPVCYAECIRTGPMQFEITASKLINHAPTGNKKEDVRHILVLLNQLLEQSIRKAPEQYLWAHRRWRD
jgi:Kdo2-lipid IVA lauroyltransferase/acyltransferase